MQMVVSDAQPGLLKRLPTNSYKDLYQLWMVPKRACATMLQCARKSHLIYGQVEALNNKYNNKYSKNLYNATYRLNGRSLQAKNLSL